jgi:hypothetical protein
LTPTARGVEYVGAKGQVPILVLHDGTPIARITSDFGGFAVWLVDPLVPGWATHRRTFDSLADAQHFINLYLL